MEQRPSTHRVAIVTVMLAVSVASVGAGQRAATHHVLKATPTSIVRGYYDASSKPALVIDSGDTVDIQTVRGSTAYWRGLGVPADFVLPPVLDEIERSIPRIPGMGSATHWFTGPIFVRNAEPGDTLEVRIEAIRLTLPYAYSVITSEGILGHEFPESNVLVPLDLTRMEARLDTGVRIPLRPFFGSIGVAPPAADGRVSSSPPGKHGGNLDNKELVAGTTLYLPVHVSGALLQMGDGHAAQGNGEATVTALETWLDGRVRLSVIKGDRLPGPRAETPTHWIAMGLHADLDEAVRIATRNMVDWLAVEAHVTRETAYRMCSVAGDIAVTQAVDGVKGVHLMVPKSIIVH